MPNATTIATGIDAAIGCDYRRDEQKLFFVEYDGSIARWDLLQDSAGTLASGTATIDSSYHFDFDAGSGSVSDADEDVWWHGLTDTERQLEPDNGAALAYLGDVAFSSVSAAEVQQLDYDTSRIIDGSDGTSNELFEGAVFAVRTTDGNYAKAQVTDHGKDIEIEYRTYDLRSAYHELGTGYDRPEDIVLSADERHAYVTERGGTLLKVDLQSADRTDATVLASGLTAPHQIALDEDQNRAYLVEFSDSGGRLLRVDLTTGGSQTIYAGLDRAVGLLVDGDNTFAYVSEQRASGTDGQIRRIQLQSGASDVVVKNLTSPFMLSWGSESEDRIVFTERDPENAVTLLDLTTRTTQTLIDDVPFRPSSVALVDEDELLVCSNDVIARVDLVSDIFGESAPLLMGIGHVPVTDISNDGYANTQGPGYPLKTTEAPFGGRLPIRINHDRAYGDEGARYYRLLVDGEEPRQTWNQLKWTTSTDRFTPTSISPSSGGYYRVHRPGEIWYRDQLGYRLSTGSFENGEHTITVKFYGETNRSSLITEESVTVHLDNQHPRAEIGAIFHELADGTEETIGACGIVDTATDKLQLEVTAQDPEGHLRNWHLRTLWGDNESQTIDSDSYENHDDSIIWSGVEASRQPAGWLAVDEDLPDSASQCAHTFHLTVWDRTVNGYHHIHRSRYHKSITIMLPA